MSDTPIHSRRSRRGRTLAVVGGVLLTLALGLTALLFILDSFFYNAGTPTAGGEISMTADGLPDGSVIDPGRPGGGQLSYDSYLRLQTDDPSATMERASQMIRDRGGSVVHLSIRQGDEHSASAQFRIPTNRALETLDDLSEMGLAAKRQLTATDMGPSTQGIQEQIQQAQAEVDRLVQQVAGADPSVRAYYERQLSQARNQLSDSQSQLTSVQRQVRYTDVSVEMATKPLGFASGGVDSWAYAADKGWQAVLATVGVLLTVVAFLFPFMGAAILMVVMAAFAWRLLRRGWAVTKPLFR